MTERIQPAGGEALTCIQSSRCTLIPKRFVSDPTLLVYCVLFSLEFVPMPARNCDSRVSLSTSATHTPIICTRALQEKSINQAQLEQSVRKSNWSRDQQLKNQQRHDIINQFPLLEEPAPPPPRETSRTYGSGQRWHLLNGEVLPDQLQSDYARNAVPPRPMYDHAPSLVRRRAVDILSNAYLNDDAGKKSRDAVLARDRAVNRWWQTHNFDPITQQYYDNGKEEAARHLEDLSKTVQGKAQRARLPACLTVRTGQAYDIVGHVPIAGEEETLRTVDLMDTRHLRTRTRNITEARLHTAGEQESAVHAVRSVHRIRTQKYEMLVDPHGYDIVSNQDTGDKSETVVRRYAQSSEGTRAWDRITRDLSTAPASMESTFGAADSNGGDFLPRL